MAQENNPKLESLLNDNKGYTRLKDFDVEQEPGEEVLIPVVLSKNTIYSLSVYLEEKNQFFIELLKAEKKTSTDRNIVKSLTTVQINENSLNMEYKISETAIYYILVKNKSNKKANSVVLLSFVGKFNDNDLSEEVITITSKGNPEKETLKEFQETTEIYFIVEEMPKFNGKSNKAFLTYVQKELRYPQEASENNIEGQVYVSFVVGKNGYIKNAKIERGVHPSIDQEALRVIYSSPKWKPGMQDGNFVDVMFTFPIQFKIAK